MMFGGTWLVILNNVSAHRTRDLIVPSCYRQAS